MSVQESLRDTFDAQGRLNNELVCLKCEYNLFMQHFGGNCPECGLPVRISARGELLQFSEPQWVYRLKWGVTLLFTGGWGVIACAICGFLDSCLFDPIGGELFSFIGDAFVTMMVISAVVSAILILAGTFYLTSIERQKRVRFKPQTMRLLCRYSLLLFIMFFISLFVLEIFPYGLYLFLPGFWALVLLILGLGVYPVSLFKHLSRMMSRLPDRANADLAHGVAVMFGVSCTITLIPFFIEFFFTNAGDSFGLIIFGLLLGAGSGVGGLFALNNARIGFHKAFIQSRYEPPPEYTD